MITYKDVFAKRKEGDVDEAYQLALLLMQSPQKHDFDSNALAWCLIDIIKRDVQAGNNQNIDHYRLQLEAVNTNPGDDVLPPKIQYALSLCNPYGQLLVEAEKLSKIDKNHDAIELYRKVWQSGAANQKAQTNFGWALYKDAKALASADTPNKATIKRELNDYLKLDLEKPSLLHSLILTVAAKFAGDGLDMLAFSRIWDLKYLRAEDYERFHTADGKDFPSLAEKVIQQASKAAAISDNVDSLNYVLPYIDSAIDMFPDNIWLKLNKAKVMLALGNSDAALSFGLEVVKSKMNEFWAWNLLGDICQVRDREAAIACYCKALLSSSDYKFIGNLKLKFAECMAAIGEYAVARLEVDQVSAYREREGQRQSEVTNKLVSLPWYQETVAAVSNLEFYRARAPIAEALLFSQLPWISACVGEKFTIPMMEGKPKPKTKRTLYVATSTIPVEVSIPEMKADFSGYNAGDSLRIKGEEDDRGRFQVYVIEKREEGLPWDVFPETVGVIDHVNEEKRLIHFMVDRKVAGVVQFSALKDSFVEGDCVALMLAKYTSKQGERYRVLQAGRTDLKPAGALLKDFREEVREERGMGFTASDIFVPPNLMRQQNIQDNDLVSGIAIDNFDKKQNRWGWKAVSISKNVDTD
ncbi:hypothetical protein OAD24_09910 [Pseudomonadales bacterium]|nr:hypothetical protein [Pseudomonadales bacterium]